MAKKISKLQRIKDKFYWTKEHYHKNGVTYSGEPRLDAYGVYRIGLTTEEIEDYIRARANSINIKKLINKFCNIAGANTMGITPDGRSLMYRHDVQRFADVLFKVTKETYFD